MKIILTLIATLSISISATAQVTNVKAGNWSDKTVWATNLVPTAEDDVQLNYDITIDVNAECLSFNSNGHNVTVKAGANLTTLGSLADTLLAKTVNLISVGTDFDTASVTNYTYDSLKRNVSIQIRDYDAGSDISVAFVQANFFYQGNSREPYKQIVSTNRAHYPRSNRIDTTFFTWQNGLITKIKYSNGLEVNYAYKPDSIIQTYQSSFEGGFIDAYFAAAVTYQNGNLIRQAGPEDPYPQQHTFTFDNHPNPFLSTQAKMIAYFPLYGSETAIEEIFSNNNVTSIYENTEVGISSSQIAYEYRPNGYPKTAYDAAFGKQLGYLSYFYTH